MPNLRLLLAAAACVAVTACAQERAAPPVTAPPPPVAQPAPSPPPAVTQYDGRYIGTATRTSRASAQCRARTLRTTMTVRGGQASLTAGSGRAGPLEGAVAADGSLSLASANARGAGRFNRTRFAGQVEGGDCTYRIALNRSR